MDTRYIQDMCTAARWGYTDSLIALRETTTDWEERDDHGMTPLMLAVLGKHIWNIKLLLDAGAKINARTPNGRTALMLAASTEYTDGMRFLIAAGAGINAKDNSGYTAIMHAVSRNKIFSLRLLLDAGADPLLPDNLGYTPYGRAVRWNRWRIANLLKQHGASESHATPTPDTTPADATADTARLQAWDTWQQMSTLETDTEFLPAALRGERDASQRKLVIRHFDAIRSSVSLFIRNWMDKAFEESPDGYFTVFGRAGILRMAEDAQSYFDTLGITLAGDALEGLKSKCTDTIVSHEHWILD